MGTVKRLSWFQTVTFVLSSFLPVTYWTFPQIVTSIADMDAVWAVLGFVIAGLLIAWITSKLNQMFPDINGARAVLRVFGPWIGQTVLIFYLFNYMLFVATSTFLFVTEAISPFLAETPQLAMLLAVCLTGAYGAFGGVEALARIASIVGPVAIGAITVIFALGMIQRGDYLPYGLPTHMVNLQRTLLGTYSIIPLLLGFNLTAMIAPYYVSYVRNKWLPVFSVAMSGLSIIVCFISVLMVFGFEGTKHLDTPVTEFIRSVRTTGFPIENFGVVFILVTVVFNSLFIGNNMWGISTLTAVIFGLKDDDYKKFIIPLLVVMMFICEGFPSDVQAMEFVQIYLTPVTWLLLLVVPLIQLVIATIQQKMKGRSAG